MSIRLEVGPNGENIHVEKQPDGYYAAYDQDNYDLGCPVGYGKTEDEAIAELLIAVAIISLVRQLKG